MSTVNEQALPNPADQPNPAAVVPAATSGGMPLGVTSIEEITDPDLKELEDAKAEVKAEEAAAAASRGDQVNGNAAQPAAAGTPPKDQQPPAQADGHMVPKARLDEALRARDEARQQAAYQRGRAEARAPQGEPAANGNQPAAAPTAEQRIAEADSAIDALAKRFDDGEITMADYKKQERELEAKKHGIREEALLARVPKAPAGGGDALYLETLTADLEKNHPWVNVFDQVGTDSDWKYLEATARERLADRGITEIKGTIGSFELRKEIATLTSELGPALLTTRAKAKGIALPGQAAPPPPVQQQQQQQQLSPEAKARLDKLNLQNLAPPNASAMTGAAGGDGVPDSSIEHMSDEDIDKLPAATRRRLLGTTG